MGLMALSQYANINSQLGHSLCVKECWKDSTVICAVELGCYLIQLNVQGAEVPEDGERNKRTS